jgi:hypothetical protein
MKIWWPRRRKKQLLSLFEDRIGWPHEGSACKPSELAADHSAPETPYPKNAPGPFYVVNEECVTCGYPHFLAPDLMSWDEAEGILGMTTHCYFAKQPEQPDEIERAIKAVAGSCCGALKYAGTDPDIQKRLRKAGARQAIVKRR